MQTTNATHTQLPLCSALPTLRRNDHATPNGIVEYLQESLTKNRNPVDIDGIFGPDTQQAVINFQTKKGITVDGIVGPQTWNQLKACVSEHAQLPPCSSLPTLERNDYQPAPDEYVTYLQQNLNKNGAKLKIDGLFGKNTQQAVRNFQTQKGITVDGIVGPQTWSQLNACFSEPPC
jgi:peptidoglycan hydrolase-like protein with peptidoglycan-binding domain